jgi:hypothetical protein
LRSIPVKATKNKRTAINVVERNSRIVERIDFSARQYCFAAGSSQTSPLTEIESALGDRVVHPETRIEGMQTSTRKFSIIEINIIAFGADLGDRGEAY